MGIAAESKVQRDLSDYTIHDTRFTEPSSITTTAETPVNEGTLFIDGNDPALQMKYDTEEDFKTNNTQAYGTPDAPKKKRK